MTLEIGERDKPLRIEMFANAVPVLVGWPVVARGVRGIIASERERDYVTAGRALGAEIVPTPCRRQGAG